MLCLLRWLPWADIVLAYIVEPYGIWIVKLRCIRHADILKRAYLCQVRPFWTEIGVTEHNFGSWPPKDHRWHVCYIGWLRRSNKDQFYSLWFDRTRALELKQSKQNSFTSLEIIFLKYIIFSKGEVILHYFSYNQRCRALELKIYCTQG
jgi:hypothetical protein